MTAILYPVAETAEAALHAPRGYAARAREAEVLGGAVRFVSEVVGPAFPTEDAARAAYGGSDGDVAAPTLEMGWRTLAAVSSADGRPLRQPAARPVYRDGRRWPEPAERGPTLWRLVVAYWRIDAVQPKAGPADVARRLRRSEAGRELDAAALAALAQQPLHPARLQQPLDIGLFEVRRPEAPDVVIPDE